MRSIGAVLAESRGIGKGFDTMRILLSVAILVVHSFVLCYGWGINPQFWAGPAGSVSVLLLPAFFALSGFLVTGSALRTGSLTTFISLRALRILPALFTEVVLAAVLIGAVATNLPVGEYYTDPGTVSYLVNIIGHITYTLPGAFADNPVPVVNGSLWTIAPEISCYIFMALMILANTYRSCLPCCMVFLVGSLAQIATGAPLPDRFFAGGLEQFELLLCFVAGNILFLARNRIPDHPVLFLVCATLSLATLRNPNLVVLGLLPLTYCTVWLGLRNLPRIPLVSKGDYSYGVYLYAYPVQQLVVLALPDWRIWWVNVVISLPLTFVFAAFSWHCIEKRALRLRTRLDFLAGAESILRTAPIWRFTVAAVLLCYGALLLRWSGFARTVFYSLSATWPLVLAAIVTLAIIIAMAGGRRLLAGTIAHRPS